MKKKILAVFVAAFALVFAFALVGCGGSSSSSSSSSSSADKVELQVFAANSLEKAMPEVQALYTKEHSNVTFKDTQFKASGDLVSQLQGGASADVLITASTGTMDTASKNGNIDDDTRKTMFTNELVVITAENSDTTISSLQDLASDSIASIAIGEPNAVPAGKYATQALESAALITTSTDADGKITIVDGTVAGKLNAGADKVGTVANYVKEGQCQVGFVYSSDLYRYTGIKNIYTTPSDSHKAINYPGAVVKGSANAETAADFLNFCMTNEDAIKIFQQYGFELSSK